MQPLRFPSDSHHPGVGANCASGHWPPGVPTPRGVPAARPPALCPGGAFSLPRAPAHPVWRRGEEGSPAARQQSWPCPPPAPCSALLSAGLAAALAQAGARREVNELSEGGGGGGGRDGGGRCACSPCRRARLGSHAPVRRSRRRRSRDSCALRSGTLERSRRGRARRSREAQEGEFLAGAPGFPCAGLEPWVGGRRWRCLRGGSPQAPLRAAVPGSGSPATCFLPVCCQRAVWTRQGLGGNPELFLLAADAGEEAALLGALGCLQ